MKKAVKKEKDIELFHNSYKRDLKTWTGEDYDFVNSRGVIVDPETQELSQYHKLLIKSNLKILKAVRDHLELIRKIIEKTKKSGPYHKTITFYNYQQRPYINGIYENPAHFLCKTKLFIITMETNDTYASTVVWPTLFDRFNDINDFEPTAFEIDIPRLNTLKTGKHDVIGFNYANIFNGRIGRTKPKNGQNYYRFNDMKKFTEEDWAYRIVNNNEDSGITMNPHHADSALEMLVLFSYFRRFHLDEQKLFDFFGIPEKSRNWIKNSIYK